MGMHQMVRQGRFYLLTSAFIINDCQDIFTTATTLRNTAQVPLKQWFVGPEHDFYALAEIVHIRIP